MQYRRFGKTELLMSEIGFGSWGIGGEGYGSVQERDALHALHEAEELGCNVIDTARVYGKSEELIGHFLKSRKGKWIVATKYSGQREGLEATVNAQLDALGLEQIDFYQLHWVPRESDKLFLELESLQKSGKIRYCGVSLYTAHDIDYVLNEKQLDGFQLKLSLLDPQPFLKKQNKIKEKQSGVLVRSCLREGFLTGKFTGNATTDFGEGDQRKTWSTKDQKRVLAQIEYFRFLEAADRGLREAAILYPLGFPEVSSVLVGCKNPVQVRENMSVSDRPRLSMEELNFVRQQQNRLGMIGGWRFHLCRLREKLARLIHVY